MKGTKTFVDLEETLVKRKILIDDKTRKRVKSFVEIDEITEHKDYIILTREIDDSVIVLIIKVDGTSEFGVYLKVE